MWERRNVNRALQCHAGFGISKMDVGRAKLQTTATRVKWHGQPQKKLGKKSRE